MRERVFPHLPVPFPLPYGGWLLLHNDMIGNSLLWGTFLEQDELGLVIRLLRPGMVFFDLGANQGVYSIVAAHAVGPRGRVHAFEPAPSEYKKLTMNIRLNLVRNVQAEQMAVSRFVGHIRFYVCQPELGSYSSVMIPVVPEGTKVEEVEVQATSLDAYIAEHRISQIDILKMDVEGGELDVIRGGKKVFEVGPRPIVFCEFSDRRTSPWGYRAREIADTLTSYGYVWFEPLPEGAREHKIQDYYDYDDLMAVPQEKLNLVDAFLM